MTTATEYSPGVESMMRRGVDRATRAGAALVAASIATAAAMIVAGDAAYGRVALGLAASGSGLIAAALGAKGWQAQAETREVLGQPGSAP